MRESTNGLLVEHSTPLSRAVEYAVEFALKTIL